MQGAPDAIELFHGYTYSAHPLACAAGLATLDVYRDQNLFARAGEIAPLWEKAAHALRQAPHVIDIRNIGLLAAIDIAPRDGAAGARSSEIAARCYEDGILIRGSGDTLVLSPPLIVTEDQIARIFSTIRRALDAVD
jgi:beta-alanine--pyruvate transaminase